MNRKKSRDTESCAKSHTHNGPKMAATKKAPHPLPPHILRTHTPASHHKTEPALFIHRKLSIRPTHTRQQPDR